jgi:hypothetical protein
MMQMIQGMRTYGSEEERQLQELLSSYQTQLALAIERIEESRALGLPYKKFLAGRREAKAYWGERSLGVRKLLRAEIRKNERRLR